MQLVTIEKGTSRAVCYRCRIRVATNPETEQNRQSKLETILTDSPDHFPTDADLCAYLDEQLPVEPSAQIEKLLRSRADLRQRAALLARRRDSGGGSVGEVWRRNRLSCPSRRELGNFVLGILEPGLNDYISFHLQIVECRLCQANLDDMQSVLDDSADARDNRQQRYFESSAGLLRSARSGRS